MTALLRSSQLRTTPRLLVLLFLSVFTTFLMMSSSYHQTHMHHHHPDHPNTQNPSSSVHSHPVAKTTRKTSQNPSLYIKSDYNSEDLQDLTQEKRFHITPNWRRYLSRDVKVNDTLFEPSMNVKEKQILYETLQQLHEGCESVDVTCMMYGGTLLGSWRHHDIIPWDGDADVFVNTTSKDDLYATLKMYSPAYEVTHSSGRFKLYSRKAKKLSKYPWKWPYVDIWFFRENETHIWDEYTSKAYQREYIYPKDVVFPVHLRPFGKILLNAPKDSFRFLQITYATTDCETHFYNHKIETTERWRFKSVPCIQFKDSIGFVHRMQHSNRRDQLVEVLYKGKKKIHALLVNEPSYAISDPYNLTLM